MASALTPAANPSRGYSRSELAAECTKWGISLSTVFQPVKRKSPTELAQELGAASHETVIFDGSASATATT
jgi:hypothetical protein